MSTLQPQLMVLRALKHLFHRGAVIYHRILRLTTTFYPMTVSCFFVKISINAVPWKEYIPS